MDQGFSIFHKSSSGVNILAGREFTPIVEKLEVNLVQLDKSQVVRVPMFGLVRPVVGVDDDFGNLDSLKNARFQNNRNTSCRQRKYKLQTNEEKRKYKLQANAEQWKDNLAVDHSSCLLPRLFYRAEGHFDPGIKNSDNSFHIRTCTNLSLNPLP